MDESVMRKLILSLFLYLLPSLAIAQCNGVFSANQVCGSVAGGLPGPVASTSFPPGSLIVGTTTITNGTSNGLLYDNAGVLGNLATGNSGVLITSAGGVPSIATTLPSGLTIPSPTLSGTVGGALTWSGAQTFNAALTYGGVTLSNSVTGTGSMVLSTSPILVTPTLGVAKATTLEATDGSACTDHAAGAQIFVCRNNTLGASTNSHAFSTSDNVTVSSNGDATNAYDDETTISGTANPNHHNGFQFFASYTGSGTMTNLVGYSSVPGSVAGISGTITNLYHYSANSPTISGGSIGTQYGYACATTLSGATANRCFFSTQGNWNEFRGHIITGPFQPTLTSCGTNPAILGSDTAGEVTMGTGSPTGCTITFDSSDYQAYASKPLCTVSWQTNLASMQYTVVAGAITLTQTGTSSNKVNYTCIAQAGG